MRVLVLLGAMLAGAAMAQTPADSAAHPVWLPRRDTARTTPVPPALPAGTERRRPLPRVSLLAGNVAAGAALTTARGLAEGRAGRHLPALALGGAASGAGFYAAKHLVGERQTVAGFAVAYASASLAENVAEGRHALSHVRVGFGPLDLRIATPWARGDTPGVRLEADPASVVAAVVLPLNGFRPRGCRGGLCYAHDEPVRFVRSGQRYRRVGRTVGRVVRVWPPFTERTEVHEGVHVIQGMQLMAATPRGTVRELAGWSDHADGDAEATLDARVDWLAPVFGGLVFTLVPYHRVWTEREAFTFGGSE